MAVPNLEKALGDAAKGLMYPSETDAPLEPFVWPETGELTPKKVRELGGHPAKAKVEETTLDDFFEVPTTEEDWHGPEEKAVVKKFRALVQVLKDRLKDIKVFRVGKTEVAVHIVGRTPDGKCAGLTTKVVET